MALAHLRRQEDEGVVGEHATYLAAMRAAGLDLDDDDDEFEPDDPRLAEAEELHAAAEQLYAGQLRYELDRSSAYQRALAAENAKDAARKNSATFTAQAREWAKHQDGLSASDEAISVAVHAAAEALAPQGVDLYGLIATRPEVALDHIIALESAATQIDRQEKVRRFHRQFVGEDTNVTTAIKYGADARPPSLDDFPSDLDQPAVIKRATHRRQTVADLRNAVLEPERTSVTAGITYGGLRGEAAIAEAVAAGERFRGPGHPMTPGVHAAVRR
jgi:hypothetical protein